MATCRAQAAWLFEFPDVAKSLINRARHRLQNRYWVEAFIQAIPLSKKYDTPQAIKPMRGHFRPSSGDLRHPPCAQRAA